MLLYLLKYYLPASIMKKSLFGQPPKNPALKKLLPFELICAVNLDYIVTSNFVRPYAILLPLYIQYTKKPAIKKWLPFELICAVYIITLNSYDVVTWYKS